MAQTPKTEVYHYIAAIRNKAKQDYARAYWSYIRAGETGPEPERGDLSVMGAQAVRHRLWEFRDMMNKNPAQWAHGIMDYRHPPGSIQTMRNNPLSRRKARFILHEGTVRGHRLTEKQRRFFGARASGYPMRINPRGGQFYLNARRGRRGRRNPARSGGGANWLLIGGLAVGAFFLLRPTTAGASPFMSLFGGAPAAVPPGYTPIGSGLYRAPNGAIVARNPQTGQMVTAPYGSQPTSAEDLLTRAGISLIPSVANNLASWISSMFSTQQTSTGAVVGGLPGGTVGGEGTTVTAPDVLSGSYSYLPPLAPLPDTGGYIPWGGEQVSPETLFGGGDLPPITDLPTYPVSDWGMDWGSLEYGGGQGYDVPGVAPLDYDVAIGVGSGDIVISNPDDWYGFFGLGARRRPYLGLRATPPVY